MSLVAPQTANEFWGVFSAQVDVIKVSLRSPPEEETVQYILNIKSSITDLQQYATISTITLPAYDIKRSQDIIECLNKDTFALDTKLNPKKKFFFKSRLRKAESAAAAAAAGATSQSVPTVATDVPSSSAHSATATTQSTINSLLPPGAYVITQRANETILLTAEALRANTLATTPVPADGAGASAEVHAQLFIKDNKNCKIIVPSLLGSVRIEYTSDCEIHLGACCTSVYLESVKNCTIYILTHQLRIHTCSDCKLYVRVNSHPIIEDCTNMGFAPYAYQYDTLDADIQAAGLQTATHWNTVKDFRWHKTTHSPNWYEITPIVQQESSSAVGTLSLASFKTDGECVLQPTVIETVDAVGSSESFQGMSGGGGETSKDPAVAAVDDDDDDDAEI